jgi:hypothetical protein
MSIATENFACPSPGGSDASAVVLKLFAEVFIGVAVLAAFVTVGATTWLFGMLVGWL